MTLKPELFLFSGGVESTVLLKYFLKDTEKLLHVLYTELAYDEPSKKRLTEQKIASKEVLNYLNNNYRGFNYSSLSLNLNNISRERTLKNGFGFDEHWNLFFAGMYAKFFDIENIWIAEFSYCNTHSTKTRGYPAYWYHDGTLEKFASLGLGLDWNKIYNLKINFPSRNFNKTKIDSFNSKKEAFDYLEPELKKLIRSCEGEEKFCGKCGKCVQYKELGLVND
jgi:7-cyano-7-deazaguanine synthase in queuosine biosynthesis